MKPSAFAYIFRHDVSIVLRPELLAHEVAQMANDDQAEVADVRREQDVVRGLLLFVALQRHTRLVHRSVPEVLVGAVAILDMTSREDLLRCRRVDRSRETGFVVVECRLNVVVVVRVHTGRRSAVVSDR